MITTTDPEPPLPLPEPSRRKWTRLPVLAAITITSPTRTAGELIDFSPGGYGVRTDWPLCIGDRCIAHINGDQTPMTLAAARVVWITEDPLGFRVGLRFD